MKATKNERSRIFPLRDKGGINLRFVTVSS